MMHYWLFRLHFLSSPQQKAQFYTELREKLALNKKGDEPANSSSLESFSAWLWCKREGGGR
jgi:hypothetical protein